MGWPSSGGCSICNQPIRSAQPPGSLNRVPASAGVRAGISHVTSAGWQVTLCDPILHVRPVASAILRSHYLYLYGFRKWLRRSGVWFRRRLGNIVTHMPVCWSFSVDSSLSSSITPSLFHSRPRFRLFVYFPWFDHRLCRTSGHCLSSQSTDKPVSALPSTAVKPNPKFNSEKWDCRNLLTMLVRNW